MHELFAATDAVPSYVALPLPSLVDSGGSEPSNHFRAAYNRDVRQQAAGTRSGSGPSGIGALESLPQSLKDLQLGGDAQNRDGKEPVRRRLFPCVTAALLSWANRSVGGGSWAWLRTLLVLADPGGSVCWACPLQLKSAEPCSVC